MAMIFSASLFADANLRLDFPVDTITTGELVQVQLVVDSASVQSFPVQSLKGKTVGEVFYFQSMSPLIKRTGEDNFSADAEIVFTRAPESNEVVTEFEGQKLKFFWNNVRINSLEVPKDYVLGDFVIPSPKKIMLWLISFAGLILLFWGGWSFKKRRDKKLQSQNELKHLKQIILSGKSYDDVVALWQQKKLIISKFPHTEEPFAKLEVVLFKYQFKPSQTAFEQSQVLESYRGFVRDVEGGFRGI